MILLDEFRELASYELGLNQFDLWSTYVSVNFESLGLPEDENKLVSYVQWSTYYTTTR